MNINPQIREKILRLLYFHSREKFARKLGVKMGKNCRIFTTYWGSEPYLIEIGNNVIVGRKVNFVTHDGSVGIFRDKLPNFDVYGKIKIGNNSFIGNESMILPGVSIGDNCIIGAMSLVTKSVPDNIVVAGNPAKYICTSEEYFDKIKHLNLDTKGSTFKEKEEKIRNLPEEKQIKKDWLKF